MKKSNINKVARWLTVWLTAVLVTGCSHDDTVADLPQPATTMTMNFKAILCPFEGYTTRADDWQWQDGAMVYLQFYNGTTRITGHAVYSKSTGTWEASFNGTLATSGRCEAYFFDGASTASKSNVTLSDSQPTYADQQAAYSTGDQLLTVTATLTPLTSRLRLQGNQGVTASISGLSTYTAYDADKNQFAVSTASLTRTVESSGYTPYIYCTFSNPTTRELTITNSIDGSDVKFTRNFATTVLAVGESGYIAIPTKSAYTGWTVDEPQPVYYLNISTGTLAMAAEASSASITVDTNTDYTISTSDNLWLTATASTDKKTVTVKAAANTATTERKGTVTLSGGGLSKNIQVRQEAAKITPTPPSGKELTITVTNNGKTVSFNMIAVNAGTFMMGATNSSSVDNAHKVTLTKSYYMGETEVTQALWNTVMGTNALWFGTNGLGDNYPVYNVSYNDCLDFIRKLNSLTGRNFRLPTEAEWELAAKGGSTEAGYLYAGSDIASNVARYSSKGTNVVKSLQPNQLGLYDMSGNVQEWCQDYYADYTAEDQTDPTGPASGTMRVMRGGSFNDAREMCTVIHRKSTSPEDTNAGLGLRLALTL